MIVTKRELLGGESVGQENISPILGNERGNKGYSEANKKAR